VVNHERQQTDESIKVAHESRQTLQENDAAQLRDAPSLINAIGKAVTFNDDYNKFMGYDKNTAQVKNEEVVTKIIESSVMSTLKETGNLAQAQSLLDGVKDWLPGAKYNETKDKLIKGYDAMKSQTEKIKVESRVTDRFDYIGRIADGTLGWEDSDKIIRGIAIKDPALAEAMTKVVNSQGEYFPEETDNEAYSDLVKNIFTAGSKEEVSNFLIEALNASANKEISKDRLAILVSAAQQRAKSLPTGTNDEPITLSPTQNEIDAGVKSIVNTKNKQFSVGNMIDNFFKGITAGKSPQDAHTEAVKSEVNRTNPSSVAHKIDDIIPLPNGKLFQVTGFTTTGSPKGKIVSGKSNSDTK
jgi:hypothetical protein